MKPWDLILVPVQGLLAFFVFYYFVIAVAGFARRRREPEYPPSNRFALLIPAHNEEQVLGPLLENLEGLDYPRNLYEIFVIADNCIDSTAELAESLGAHVLERFSPDRRGKGYAVEWAMDQLLKMVPNYDAVVVVDADNLVDPRFLRVMNGRLLQGEQIIQGYLHVKNPFDSWVSGSTAVTYWRSNRAWYLGKYNLGLPVSAGGTGQCISTDVLRKLGWGATCLTEDFEFSMRALVQGISTSWAHDAVIYDEKPITLGQSLRQRLRWAQGRAHVAYQYLLPMLGAAVRDRDIRKLDACLDLASPFVMSISVIFSMITSLPIGHLEYTSIFTEIVPSWLWLCLGAFQYLIPVLAMRADRIPMRACRYLPVYLVYIFFDLPLAFAGLVSWRNRRWTHTTHSRAVRYDELAVQRAEG